MPFNTRTTSALRLTNQITEPQIEAAVNAALAGWARRAFPFNDDYSLDLNVVLTFDARVCGAMVGSVSAEAEKRSLVRGAILRAVPKRTTV